MSSGTSPPLLWLRGGNLRSKWRSPLSEQTSPTFALRKWWLKHISELWNLNRDSDSPFSDEYSGLMTMADASRPEPLLPPPGDDECELARARAPSSADDDE